MTISSRVSKPACSLAITMNTMDLTSGVVACKGKRKDMEDTYCRYAMQNSNLYAVFDGHGGSQVATQAAHLLPLTFDTALGLPAAITAVDELLCPDTRDEVGSTVVAAVVDPGYIYIAHAGDSRAVLVNGGDVRFSTTDHKADNEAEADRIRANGGSVFYYHGALRVGGQLVMTRALGDHALRSAGVTAEADTICMDRLLGDDLLILATDGLWDVMQNQEAASLVCRCMQRAAEKGVTRSAALRIAATVLTRAAIKRGSSDDVTAMVIDVQLPQAHVPIMGLVPALSA